MSHRSGWARFARLALLGCAALIAAPVAADPLHDAIQADMPELMKLYQDLHANPELSGYETETAAKLSAIARELGYDVTEGVGKTGVVAVMENGPGPIVMIRADMDGLPVEEQTGLSFASKVIATTDDGIESPVMHACGHDTHMAGWVGAATALAEMKDQWSGTLVMILQPAEERGWGAKWMIDDGLFTRFPRPTHAIAFHDNSGMPAGSIGYVPGFALANVDSVDIKVKGVGGHGAYPNTTKDPIVLASKIVTSLQTLVSRELDPQEPAVVTVGSFRAGAKHNIIPNEAMLLLTVRSYSDETRTKLLDGIKRIAEGEAVASGFPADAMPEVTVKDEFTPSTYNTPEFTKLMADVFTQRFGEDRVMEAKPVMGGEDFGRFYRADNTIESMIFWVGGVPAADWQAAQAGEKELPSLHNSLWAPDAEAVVGTGAEALAAAALNIMAK